MSNTDLSRIIVMTGQTNTFWGQFLKPIIFDHLINQTELQKLKDHINWEQQRDRVANFYLAYPDYYQSQNHYGIVGGYLTPDVAVSYDAITQYLLPPNETWVREDAIKHIQGEPRYILDLGCGTGSMTVLLQKAFPNAQLMGLDLSPYMLIMAERKAQMANLAISWQHGKAEDTGIPGQQFDLITASLLFHETPVVVTKAILQQAYQLLQPGGQVVFLDANQTTLQNLPWITNLFEQPYIQQYLEGNIEAWLETAGFAAIHTHQIWGIHQVTRAVKPLPSQSYNEIPLEDDLDMPAAAPA